VASPSGMSPRRWGVSRSTSNMYERRIDKFRLHERGYRPVPPDTSGLLCSAVLPDLASLGSGCLASASRQTCMAPNV
jgi:hypothetical protein